MPVTLPLTGRIYTPTLPPTEVTPALRARPLTGALNHKLFLLGEGCAYLKAWPKSPDKKAVGGLEPLFLYWQCLSESYPAA